MDPVRIHRSPGHFRWPVYMRVLSLFMAFHLCLLPQLLTTQSVVAIYEESGTQLPTILEEEVLKHAVDFRDVVPMAVPESALIAQFHQYEEEMRDHPLMEVPHQPPRS